MRSFFRALRVDLRRSLLSGSFWLSVLLMILCMSLSVFDQLTINTRTSMSWQYTLNIATCFGWFFSMVLAISPMVYAWSYCQDRISGFYDQAVQRTGFPAYCVSRVTSVALSAFLAGVVAVGTFALLLYLGLPRQDMSLYAENSPVYMALTARGQDGLFLLLRCVHSGLTCAFAAVLGLTVSAFIPNVFVAVFFPLLFYHLAVLVQHFLYVRVIGDMFNLNQLLFGQCMKDDIRSFLWTVCVLLDCIVLMGYIFYRRAERRRRA